MPGISLFPPTDLNEALIIAETIWNHNAGKPMRRLTLFNTIDRSPESSTSRSLLTASNGYGLTKGGYQAEEILLTERGQLIVEKNDVKAKLDAVLGVKIFSDFFNNYKNSTLPSPPAGIDFLKSHGLSDKQTKPCLEILQKCGEQVELVQVITGVKRVVSVENALETLLKKGGIVNSDKPQGDLTNTQGSTTAIGTANSVGTEPKVPSLPVPHIDIQIHISADAKSDQIEKIFSCMAKYLYNRG